jgi:Flagellar hook-length control protein FliK
MTAPAAAPASAPTAPTAPRAPSQPPADRFAFAAVLDALPGAGTKASASTSEKQPHRSDEPQQDQSPLGKPPGHSLLSDGALLASLRLALRAASPTGEGTEAADNAPPRPTVAMKGPKAAENSASISATAKAGSVARLISERAFHFNASAGLLASRTIAVEAPFAAGASSAADLTGQAGLRGETGFPRDQVTLAKPFADAVPSTDNALAPATRIAPRAVGAATNRVGPTRVAARDAARSEHKPEVSSPPAAARVAAAGAAHAPAESSGHGKAPDGRPPDPIASTAPSTTRTDPFGTLLSASFAGGASFDASASATSATETNLAPAASAPTAGSAAAAPPVKEIDVDLSPGGLEDVSMTMRLAGDKLSVVVRAASSQTLSSIEGARDAIADRLAAIGQPLDSLIVKQTGVNADGNTNGNAASAEDGSTGREWRSAQGAGERGGSNDALSRRGAGRDRSF